MNVNRSADPGLPASGGSAIRWLMLVYFASGLCSLIDEVIWVRLLKTVLGSTVYASSIVVSTFMGGLALGALIMSRYADRVRRRLRLYALLELCAAASALALPWFLGLADVFYRWFFRSGQPSPAAVLVVQAMVSSALLLVPTMIMGSTLPLLGRYVTALEDRVGRLVGRLYALNTLGAAVGCFLAGSVLIRMLGVMGALYLAAAVNLLVALGGWALSRSHDSVAEQPSTPAPLSPITLPDAEGRAKSVVLLLGFFASGLISIGYELVWMRSVVFQLGGFTYVFSSVLTVYLLGNVLGAWIGSRLARRLASPAAGFGVSLTILGLFGVLCVPWLVGWGRIVEVAKMRQTLHGLGGPQFLPAVLWPLAYTTVLFSLPAVAMGIGFPLALQAWGRRQHKVGQTTGIVYGVNTIGAVLGGLVTGFVLIPLLGVQYSITLLGLAAVWVGAVLLHLFGVRPRLASRVVRVVLPVGLTVAAFLIPGDLFRRRVVALAGYEIVAVKEGVTTTVAVARNKVNGTLQMTSDGMQIAGDDHHRAAQQMLGHLGALLHGRPRTVLTIGFGSGETSLCLAQHDLERLDCVEIAPEVVDLGLQYFRHINLGDQVHEKTNLQYMDAKNYLRLTEQRYDVIVNGANIPYYSGSAPMFTKEHFETARDHLNPGGVFVTKLHLGHMARSNFDSVLGTFIEVYPHMTLWFPATRPVSFFYVVGSKEPQVFSPLRIREILQKPNVRASAAYLRFQTEMDVLSCFVGDETGIRRYLGAFRVNSDDAPFIEFNLDRQDLDAALFLPKFLAAVRRAPGADHLDWSGVSEAEREKWHKEFRPKFDAAEYVLRSQGVTDPWQALRNSADGLRLMPEHPVLLTQEEQVLSVARKALSRGPAKHLVARADAELKSTGDFAAAWLIRSWALQRARAFGGALHAAKEAARHAPHMVMAQEQLGTLLLGFNRAGEAIAPLRAVVRLRPKHAFGHIRLASALAKEKQFRSAVTAAKEAVALSPDEPFPLNLLAWLLATCPEDGVRDGARAVSLAERACQVTEYKNPALIDTLASAYAEAGRFPEAVRSATQALALAERSGAGLAEEIRARLALYKSGLPYRSP